MGSVRPFGRRCPSANPPVATRRCQLAGTASRAWHIICSGLQPSGHQPPGPPREIAQTSFGNCLREGDPNDSASA
jgi:hypothetical protein